MTIVQLAYAARLLQLKFGMVFLLRHLWQSFTSILLLSKS